MVSAQRLPRHGCKVFSSRKEFLLIAGTIGTRSGGVPPRCGYHGH